MADYTFDRVNHIIEIDISFSEITVQDLLNAIREYEDNQDNMDLIKIAEASGKEELGGEVKVGITVKLIDWKVKFADRPPPTYVVCNIRGGNLVAVNQAGVYVTPVEPSEYVTVTITASSSATIQESLDIQHSSFEGGVWIDSVNGVSGIEYPKGTHRQPVNNFTDAHTIATSRNFSKFFIIGDFIFSTGADLDGHIIEGENQLLSHVQIENGCSTEGAEFKSCQLSGTLSGAVDLLNVCIGNLSNLQGSANNCGFEGTIVLGGSSLDLAQFTNCYQASAVIGAMPIDMGGDGPALALRAYTGAVKILNKTGTSKVAIDFISGRLILDSSITKGTFFIRGVGEISDNQATGITLYDNPLVNPSEIWEELTSSHGTPGTVGEALDIMKKIKTNRWKIDNNQLTIYDNDGVTPLKTFNLKNKAGDPTETEPYERVPV